MIFTLLDVNGAVRSVINVPDDEIGVDHVQVNIDADPGAVSSVEGPPPPVDPETQEARYIAGAWSIVPLPLAVVKAGKLRELLASRYTAETNGFTASGMQYASDESAQRKIMMLVMMASLVPHFSVIWELANGSQVMLNEQQIQALGTALGNHVIAVHATERTLIFQVAAATTIAQVEAIHWPP